MCFLCSCIIVSFVTVLQATSSDTAMKIPFQRKHSLTPASLLTEAQLSKPADVDTVRQEALPTSPYDSTSSALPALEDATQLRLDYETVLPRHQAQSTIGGRDSSSACTVISVLFIRHVLHSAQSGEVNLPDECLCTLMRKGNDEYDFRKLKTMLSVDDVLGFEPSLGIQSISHRNYLPTELHRLVETLSDYAKHSSSLCCGAVLVTPPYTHSVCCVSDEFFLFDSHFHLSGTKGALLARLPMQFAVAYLKTFFAFHYPTVFKQSNYSLASGTIDVEFVKLEW